MGDTFSNRSALPVVLHCVGIIPGLRRKIARLPIESRQKVPEFRLRVGFHYPPRERDALLQMLQRLRVVSCALEREAQPEVVTEQIELHLTIIRMRSGGCFSYG